MARKVVNRKELRAEAEAAEAVEQAEKSSASAPKKKKTTRRTTRTKAVADVRMKLFWGVFNQSLRRVALYDHSQKKEAEKKAAELSKAGKTPHFVQKVKEAVEE
jgi:hypothetical protein